MRHLSIDIETRSGADISSTGAYRYAEDKEFDILLFAYAWDFGEVQIVDLANGEPMPWEVIRALDDENVIKHAYNAAFEWVCLNWYPAIDTTPIEQWQCTMIHGMYLGYPAGLDAVGKALGLEEDKKKMAIGKSLIRLFCVPQRPTKKNQGKRWITKKEEPEKWELFKEYCKQDVVTEMAVELKLQNFPVPDREWKLWQMDVKMNFLGVQVDKELIEGALTIDDMCKTKLTKESMEITGLENPNSPTQLRSWLEDMGIDTDDLQKNTVISLLEKEDLPSEVRRILEIRQQLGKTSIKKYQAMYTAMCADERVCGISQFYGANRTGRWAGRLVQMQNLPRNYIGTLDEARHLVKKANYEGLRICYGNVSDTLSQLIRTAFVPSDGHHFVVADFSAIEARVIAWLAGEQWVNEVFATHGKIYEATASQMFHVPVEKIKKGNPEYALRQKGKVATLALGYQGGTSALIAMGALKMGLTEEELPDIVTRWRNANKQICNLWYSLENAAIRVMETARPQGVRGLILSLEGDLSNGQSFFTVRLPSGRKLYYPKPYLKENQFGKNALHFYGVSQESKKWQAQSTYGGKLTENIVQAIARDCLAETLIRVQEHGYDTVFHVHDEVIIDAPMELTVDEVCKWMAEPIEWAPGLILKGAGFEGEYYKKD